MFEYKFVGMKKIGQSICCQECGREFSEEFDSINLESACTSDDCPSNNDGE